jgi:hypothetical protein
MINNMDGTWTEYEPEKGPAMQQLSPFEIRRELARQRGCVVALLEALDVKNWKKQYQNAQLEKRRRYYTPKNNGRGRPAKKWQSVSKEDEARRVQYEAEIVLLDELIACDASDTGKLVDWLTLLKDEKGEGAAWRARQRKIGRLLAGFGEKPPKVPVTERKWNHNEVRDYLTLLRDRRRARVKAFDRLPVSTVGEQDKEDAERATLAVLERFCASHHLATADVFRLRAPLIRMEVHCVGKPHHREAYRQAWFQAFDGFVETLTTRYGAS